MASMQAELNGAKRVPKTNAKKCMQNRFPNSGPPLCGSFLFCVKLQRKKIENTRLKGEFAGLKMGPSGGPVFGAAVLGKRKSKCRRFRGPIFGSARRTKKWGRRFVFFWAFQEKTML